MHIIALYGDDPGYLRRVRVPGGWHTRGHAANHPDATPPVQWANTGRCWAGRHHPVIDVTTYTAGTERVIVIGEPTDVRPPSRGDRRR